MLSWVHTILPTWLQFKLKKKKTQLQSQEPNEECSCEGKTHTIPNPSSKDLSEISVDIELGQISQRQMSQGQM